VKPQLQRVGTSQSPVVIIDEFSGIAEEVARIAESLAPFPPSGSYYPGVRRMISEADERAYSYVLKTCEEAAPYIGGAFEVQDFRLRDASFSMVTRSPDQLHATQRIPHFDSFEPNLFALLHYLRVPAGTGTAFYRHRSTAIERVTGENRDRFLAASGRELEMLGPGSGYINDSNEFFEQIGRADAVVDRMIIYPGNLLHSGIIPAGMPLSADPRNGRLTANLFIIGGKSA
jgi:hypothetical protein